jgi:hypothetical protein
MRCADTVSGEQKIWLVGLVYSRNEKSSVVDVVRSTAWMGERSIHIIRIHMRVHIVSRRPSFIQSPKVSDDDVDSNALTYERLQGATCGNQKVIMTKEIPECTGTPVADANLRQLFSNALTLRNQSLSLCPRSQHLSRARPIHKMRLEKIEGDAMTHLLAAHSYSYWRTNVTTVRLTMVRLISASCLAVLLSLVMGRQHESPFLKEILLGRCYAQPPSGDAASSSSCPSTVGSFMNILDGHLDDAIEVENFASYLDGADWASTTSAGGLFWLGGRNDRGAAEDNSIILKGWQTPESTPGGSLVHGLSFCGVDKRGHCPETTSGAYSSFWTGAYAKHTASLRGDVHIVLEGNKSPKKLTPFLLGALPELDSKRVTSIAIYSSNCHSKSVQTITSAIKASTGFEFSGKLSCGSDILALFLCQDPTSPSCTRLKRDAAPLPMKTIGPLVTEPTAKGKDQNDENKELHKILFLLLFAFFVSFFVVGCVFTSWIAV